LEPIKILQTELYVMVQRIMDILKNHVKKHVFNIVYSLYKMVMEKLDNAFVKMICHMQLDTVMLIVESLEVLGVIISIIILKILKLLKLLINKHLKLLVHIKIQILELYVKVQKNMDIQ